MNSVNTLDFEIMNEIDRIYTKCPFYGVRKITQQLKLDGFYFNHKKIYRLMKVMGIEAIFPHPNTSKPNIQHQTFPYLLKGLEISKSNQVWGVDITYIRLHNKWSYLVVLMDWYSRYVLAWKLSDNLESEFCMETLGKALSTSLPEIHNSDQGSQFTSVGYLDILKANPIAISMDGRGRCMDNIFTERLWRSLKYEEVYLKEYQNFQDARCSINQYLHFYNTERLHQNLDYQTPAKIYLENQKLIKNIKIEGGEKHS
jgi:putative transposase